jgi:hypothetical protein
MNLLQDELYPLYLQYLENKKMSVGAYNLARISITMFNEFVDKYENDESFRLKQDLKNKQIMRDRALEEILGEDFEIVLENSDDKKCNDDDIFDF